MKVLDLKGPGVTPWLREKLRGWNISELTDIQQRAIEAGVADGHSLVVSSPTSSGKTLVGEIAMLAALRSGMRTIYLVSHKALADQKYLDFVARFGEGSDEPLTSVSLNTGDRAEGDLDAQLMIATYEKALGLFLAGQLKPRNALVVADELQILAEPGRGPEIEALCSALRQRGIKQFIALTATVENPEDLAGWMKCSLVQSSHRDVPLHQEIWYGGRAFRTTFGHSEGQEISGIASTSNEVTDVVKQLLKINRGPVLVFTESRNEASNYASAFEQDRPRVVEGIAIAEQLDFFSEPTEFSDQLKSNAERGVTFHTADLSPQERQVIETGFSTSKFEVCFATTTLAAGVNFPFRSIVFPKLTFKWGDRAGSNLPKSDYRNMSGRAGRLGMHEDGFAVLLPQNLLELTYANLLVRPENSSLNSQLVDLSLRKTVLTLIASGLANDFSTVMAFFQNTLYWYQILDRNPTKLAALEASTKVAADWLVGNQLLSSVGDTLLITPLGRGAALSGLLPSTAVQFASLLRERSSDLKSDFQKWIPGLIYAACASDEFRAERPSRFFPYCKPSHDSAGFWGANSILIPYERADTQLSQCAHAVVLYVEGLAERKIAHATKLPSGSIRRLAVDVAWVLDGLHKLASVPDLNCPQAVGNQIAMLGRRVRWGAPAELLDVIRIAERHGVPGFGRHRAMALVAQGITTLHDVLATAKDLLAQILRSEPRAQSLLDAASSAAGHGPSRLATTHARVAKELRIDQITEACNHKLGVDYETAIVEFLRVETSWIVTMLDDGNRQNVPDILIQLGEQQILLECKTCSKVPPLIRKEEAWAVLQKAADFDPKMHRVTLGKPAFDETSRKKASASYDISLVEHSAFMEGLLRVHSGTLTPTEFMTWLGAPGVAEIDRLLGRPTFAQP